MVKEIKIGNILESKAQTIINAVNCVGIMGKGIALEFKKQFPAMFKDYKARCDRHEVRMGKPYIFKQLFGPNIINFPTKQHWRSVSKIDDIKAGLQHLVSHYKSGMYNPWLSPRWGAATANLSGRMSVPSFITTLMPSIYP